MEQISMGKNRWAWIVPAAVAVFITNLAIHLLYMVVYYHFINPGQEIAHYHAHSELSAPYLSIVIGMPLMFLVCWWIARRFEAPLSVTAALFVWFGYFLIHITILVFTEDIGTRAVLIVISFATKLAAAYLGGLAGRARPVSAD